MKKKRENVQCCCKNTGINSKNTTIILFCLHFLRGKFLRKKNHV